MKNWKNKAVSAVLALSILVPTAAFAADAATGAAIKMTGGKGVGQHQAFNQEKQQEFQTQLLELVTKYTPDSLTEWKSTLAEQTTLMQQFKDKQPAAKERTQLSDETKAELDAIREDVKNGNITQEKAQEKITALGIEHRVKDGSGAQGLSAEVKEQLNTIREDMKAGDITKEEAREKMKALGLDIKDKDDNDRPELSAEVKEKLAAIQEDVKNGDLTQEEAKEEMAKLGLKARGDGKKTNSMAQFKAAVEANDATKIQELLPQMLEDLKERNQAMSNRLAESQN